MCVCEEVTTWHEMAVVTPGQSRNETEAQRANHSQPPVPKAAPKTKTRENNIKKTRYNDTESHYTSHWRGSQSEAVMRRERGRCPMAEPEKPPSNKEKRLHGQSNGRTRFDRPVSPSHKKKERAADETR